MYNSPCDRDCPRRTWDCKKTCPDWEKYETAHMQELEERQKVYIAHMDYCAFRSDMRERNRKETRTRKGAWKRV